MLHSVLIWAQFNSSFYETPWPAAHEIFLLVEVRSSVEGLEVAARSSIVCPCHPLSRQWLVANAILPYRGSSLIKKHHPLGTCSRLMPRALWWS